MVSLPELEVNANVRPTSAIDFLRVQVRQIEGRRRRAQRCFPLGSLLWTCGFPGAASQSAHCMKSLAGEMAPSMEPRLHYSLPVSPRAHEERCSGVSLDQISSRQPSRKPA